MPSKIDSQMLKGVLTGSILSLLSTEELYGYKLSERLSEYGFTDISNGTIYPLLLTLEKKKLITGNMRPSENGPMRKYYSITAEGLEEKQKFITQWKTLSMSVNQLIERNEYHEDK